MAQRLYSTHLHPYPEQPEGLQRLHMYAAQFSNMHFFPTANRHEGEWKPKSFIPTKDVFKFTQDQQFGLSRRRPQNVVTDYVSRQLPGLLKEKEYSLGSINKIFAASWVSDRQVVFGTKCNKLIVMDLHTKQMAQIPAIQSSGSSLAAECPCGIHAIATNPSKTLLATGAEHTNDLAVYSLPTFDPVCAGEDGHTDWIFDIKWLDDEFLVTGSRDNNMCLWQIDGTEEPSHTQNICAPGLSVPIYNKTKPRCTMLCKKAEKVRALAYNDQNHEIAALSLNAYLHIWDAQKFIQKSSIRLKYNRENVCMCICQDKNLYAIGSQSFVTLIDSRNVKNMSPVMSMQKGCGIRSVNFNKDILSIGTGNGAIYFYDLRAQKYLDLHCGHALNLTAGKGWLAHDDTYLDFFTDQEYPNAIYAHCYDDTGTRIFAAGGPLPAGLWGNYAALWH